MSSIMRARNALTGRGKEAEVIGGVLFELKVAGPSMLGIGCPDRHPLPLIHSPPPPKMHPPRRRPPARAGSFFAPYQPFAIAVRPARLVEKRSFLSVDVVLRSTQEVRA